MLPNTVLPCCHQQPQEPPFSFLPYLAVPKVNAKKKDNNDAWNMCMPPTHARCHDMLARHGMDVTIRGGILA